MKNQRSSNDTEASLLIVKNLVSGVNNSFFEEHFIAPSLMEHCSYPYSEELKNIELITNDKLCALSSFVLFLAVFPSSNYSTDKEIYTYIAQNLKPEIFPHLLFTLLAINRDNPYLSTSIINNSFDDLKDLASKVCPVKLHTEFIAFVYSKNLIFYEEEAMKIIKPYLPPESLHTWFDVIDKRAITNEKIKLSKALSTALDSNIPGAQPINPGSYKI